LPLEQLHREEWRAVVMADLENLADVRVRERRSRARLANEAVLRSGAGIAQDLDRDGAIEALVARLEHAPHAAFADLAHDAVVANGVGHLAGAANASCQSVFSRLSA